MINKAKTITMDTEHVVIKGEFATQTTLVHIVESSVFSNAVIKLYSLILENDGSYNLENKSPFTLSINDEQIIIKKPQVFSIEFSSTKNAVLLELVDASEDTRITFLAPEINDSNILIQQSEEQI